MTKSKSGTYLLQTFGCQMNVHDSDRMEEVLQSAGFSPTKDPQLADIILFNTCSVREKAEQKLRSEVGKFASVKKERPGLIIAVAGCVAQQEGERLLKHIPQIDLVVGPDNLAELPCLIHEQMGGAPARARTVFDMEQPQFLRAHPEKGQVPVSAFVTTMKGCDERCSFCIVPYTRGPERYRPSSEILSEIQNLVSLGAKEIVLLGQTVDSYKDPSLPGPESDHPDESQFPQLLRLIAQEVKGLHRLRYTSPHPRHATASLAKAHEELDVLAQHIHLPVQSGSNRILKRMIRRYTKEEYVERATRLLSARPGMTISTDIIVGFCGETDADFQDTLSLVREMKFTSVYAFKYSVRPYTPAQKLPDDVTDAVKHERLQQLLQVTEELGSAHLASLLGTTQTVLIEGKSKFEAKSVPSAPTDHLLFQGRTLRNELVHVLCPSIDDITGHLVEASITKANKHSLLAELTKSSSRTLSTLAKSTQPTVVSQKRSLPIVF